MALFDFLKRQPKVPPPPARFPTALGAPARGTFVAMRDIPDPAFSAGVLGTCVGVDPAEGRVYAPMNGTVTDVADSAHALGMENGGIEVLLHVGVDTVKMEGKGFHCLAEAGQTVQKGDLILKMDLDAIAAAGHPAIVIMAVINADDFSSVEQICSGGVEPGDTVLRIEKQEGENKHENL